VNIIGIGINTQQDCINGEIQKLQENLQYFQDLGYDYVEISIDAVDVIYHGRLNSRRMNDLKSLLNRFDLKYTIHAPRVLDLRDVENLEVQKRIFNECILFGSEIEANIFVYHYGRKTEDEQLEEKLYQSMLEISDFAADYKVQICVENIEIDTVSNVVDFVKRIERENVGITFDFGHAYLASKYFCFNFLKSVEMATPYIKHVHVADNFGCFEEARLLRNEQYKMKKYPGLLQLGQGDLHLPPGWGEVPLDEAFEILEDYKGVFLMEYYSYRYKPYNQEILEAAKGYIKRHTVFCK